MKTIHVFFISLLLLSCTANSDQENSSLSSQELSDSTLLEELSNPETLEDSIISKLYPYSSFKETLSKSFRKTNCNLIQSHKLSESITLYEYSDDNYYYLVLGDSKTFKVLHGSEAVHCKSLFGELSTIFENSFVWISSEGCGSDENRNWYVFDFKGNLMVSGAIFLYADHVSQTLLFKKTAQGSDIYLYSIIADSLKVAAKLDRPETFQDNYCWSFERKNDKIKGVYDCLPRDTIFIEM